MSELADHERVALLTERLGLPVGALPAPLALEALRHGSFLHERHVDGDGARSNERLEFLGDAVLGLVVSLRCAAMFPEFEEGELTRLRAALVNAESLAAVARRIGLGELLLLGRGEERSGGRDKQSLLADALEAVVAAVYLACGSVTATGVVEQLLAPFFAVAGTGTLGRDYKTELQERLQAAHRAAPTYRVIDAPGPQHARVFEVEVAFQDLPLGRGSGRTKKEAEQAAARVALETAPGATAMPPPAPGERAPSAVAAVERAAAVAAGERAAELAATERAAAVGASDGGSAGESTAAANAPGERKDA
jgi:ribonuclease III